MKQMKRITQNLVWISVLAFAACSKTPVTQPVVVDPPTATTPAPVRIEKDGETLDISYHSNGNINTIVSKDGQGNVLTNYLFTYENNQLKEINFGGKWKYTYTGNNLTSVESYNTGGQLRYTYEFSYAGNKVVEKTEYLTAVYKTPRFKTTYSYNNGGNVDHIQVYQYNNNSWGLVEEVQFDSYDQHANVIESFTSFPFLPSSVLSPNNAIKETWYSGGLVTQTVTNQLSYDTNGRIKNRKSVFSNPGFPDTYSETKLTY